MGPNACTEITPPAMLMIGRRLVQIEDLDAEPESTPIQGLDEATQIPGQNPTLGRLPPLELTMSPGIDTEALFAGSRL